MLYVFHLSQWCISLTPLQTLRRHMEIVIEGVMYAPERAVKRTSIPFPSSNNPLEHSVSVLDLVSPPDLNQARVNKCLIALVNRKVVQKENSTVRPFVPLAG